MKSIIEHHHYAPYCNRNQRLSIRPSIPSHALSWIIRKVNEATIIMTAHHRRRFLFIVPTKTELSQATK